jgi:hypothetical protein
MRVLTKTAAFGKTTSTQLNLIRNDIKRDHPPSHYLAIMALRVDCHYYARGAVLAQMSVRRGKTSFLDKVHQRHLLSAKCGFSYISKIECSAACCVNMMCPRSLDGTTEPPHDPVFENSYIVFFAWKNLQMIPQSQWPSYTMRILRRYLPLLKIYFHTYPDANIEAIEAIVTEETV